MENHRWRPRGSSALVPLHGDFDSLNFSVTKLGRRARKLSGCGDRASAGGGADDHYTYYNQWLPGRSSQEGTGANAGNAGKSPHALWTTSVSLAHESKRGSRSLLRDRTLAVQETMIGTQEGVAH